MISETTKLTGMKEHLLAVVLMLICAGTVWGQRTASITGAVKDTSGAVVPGATVTAKHVETGLTRIAETDASGNYTVPSVPVGDYEISVEKAGFKKQVRRGVTLSVGQQAVLNLSLEIGNVEQQVTVTGEAPLVNTTVASTSGLVNEKEVKDLPLNGRSFDQLLTLNVGTTNYSANRASNQPGNLFSVSGRRPEENRFLMNGVDYIGASAGSNTSTPNGSNGQVMGVDAVREFNVVSHTYGAEYGKRAGGQISIVTSSGTNQLHGDVFEYLRNSVLDARNFFDYPVGMRIPPFKRNQFGGALGGPIKRDKLFLFGNFEGLRQRLGISDVAIVPDANARVGMLPCNGTTVACGSSPIGTEVTVTGLKTAMLPFVQNYWPAPNGPVLGGGQALDYANPVQKVLENFGLIRGDYMVSAKDSFSANYVIQDGENDLPATDPNFVTILPLRSQNLSLQETHVFSPSLLNVANFGFGRAHISSNTPTVTPLPANLLFVSGTGPGTITIGGAISGAGGGIITTANGSGGPTTYARNFFTWSDDLHYIKGAHTFTAGVWIQRIQSNRNGSGAAKSTVSYPTLLALLTDAPSAFQAVPATVMLGFRSTEAAWYFQDEIKLKPNLTLRLGLRDEMTSGYNESKGRCANYIFDQNGVLQTNPRVDSSCLLQNNAKALWQPRVGLAWDPTGTGTWAVRAGFGIYNDLQDNVDQAFGANPPYNGRLNLTQPLLSFIPIAGGTQPPPNCSPTQLAPCSTFSPGQLDPNMHTPTVQEWSFTVERELTKDLMLQVGYVGSQSYHLELNVDSNTVRPQVCTNTAGCDSGGVNVAPVTTTAPGHVPQGATYLPPGKRPNPYLSRTFERFFAGTSSYHALNVSLVKRLSHGLTFKTNYTFSKVLDMNSALDTAAGLNQTSDVQNPYNLALSKGPAAFNLKHQFNANFSYELPFGRGKAWASNASGLVDKVIGGWQWNAILTVQPGFPFQPTAGSNRSGSGDTANPDVPNRNPNFTGLVILGTPNHWFDTNAFLLPTIGTIGNAGRDQFLGPGLTELDTSLFKKISISERWSMQFRAEVFNVLNHANFGPPALPVFSGTTVNSSAGLITTTATNSRELQFALKLIF